MEDFFLSKDKAMDYKKILLDKIQRLIEGSITVPQFQKEYYDYFLEIAGQHVLTNTQLDFFGFVHEQLDWTAENPEEEARRYGWMNHKEYVEWLTAQTALFVKDEHGLLYLCQIFLKQPKKAPILSAALQLQVLLFSDILVSF